MTMIVILGGQGSFHLAVSPVLLLYKSAFIK